jgi:hypothetical protein
MAFLDITLMEIAASFDGTQEFGEPSHPGIFTPVPGSVGIH